MLTLINIVMCNCLIVVNANEIGQTAYQLHNYKLEEQHHRLSIMGGGRVRIS